MPSPLEVLHHKGAVRGARVVGADCPAWLVPAAPEEGAIDLVVLAPSALETASRGWWASAAAAAAAALEPEGLVYAIVEARERRRAIAALRTAGLRVERTVAHVPSVATGRALVPLGGEAADYAFVRSDDLRSRWWRSASRLLPTRLAPAVERLAPPLGLLARRAGSAEAADWLFRVGATAGGGARGDWLVRRSWRPGEGSILVERFMRGDERPSAVAKVTPVGAGNDERVALERLGPSARAAGARVPRVLGAARIGSSDVLVLAILDGQLAARLLVREPRRLDDLAALVSAWIAAWHSVTESSGASAVDAAFARVVADARRVEYPLGATGYATWLEEACARASRAGASVVASHGDLTMWNVLVDDASTLGVIDWETANEADLPLSDLYYALADAVTVSRRCTRLEAVRSCFTEEGAEVARLRQLAGRFERLHEWPADLLDVGFHACWLRHASNALARPQSEIDREFVEIAEWLVRERPRLSELFRQ